MSNGFNFGFGPLLNLLCIFGIDLRNRRSNQHRICLMLYSFGLHLGTISIILYYFIHVLINDDAAWNWIHEKRATQSFTFIFYLELGKYVLFAVLIEMSLLFWVKKTWKDVSNSLDAMAVFVDPMISEKVRRKSIYGIVYALTSVGFK